MTGIAPSDLLEDADLYTAALEEADRAEWTTLHELLAVNTEITHALYRVVLQLGGAKTVPEPLQLDRPYDSKPEPVVMSQAEAAKWLTGGGG